MQLSWVIVLGHLVIITLLLLQPAPVQPAAGSPEPPVANLIDLGGETPPVPPTSASAQLDPFAKPTLPPIHNETDVSSRLAGMSKCEVVLF